MDGLISKGDCVKLVLEELKKAQFVQYEEAVVALNNNEVLREMLWQNIERKKFCFVFCFIEKCDILFLKMTNAFRICCFCVS